MPVVEARQRFAQFGVLLAIARSRALRPILVFKGGNALDFVWQANRSTRDLDFSVSGGALDELLLEARLKPALDAVERELGITFRIHRIERQPPGPDKTFVTLLAKVGFALPDDHPVRERLVGGGVSPHVIPVEISLNEVVCDSIGFDLDGRSELRVCTVDDIVAEKLRALLQQAIRNRTRCQDVLDIAVLLRRDAPVDPKRVASYLALKAAARDVPVSRSAFYHPELARRARAGYDELQLTTRSIFIEFDDALAAVLSLVDALGLDP